MLRLYEGKKAHSDRITDVLQQNLNLLRHRVQFEKKLHSMSHRMQFGNNCYARNGDFSRKPRLCHKFTYKPCKSVKKNRPHNQVAIKWLCINELIFFQ